MITLVHVHPTRRIEVKQKMSRNQYTKDMQRPVSARLEDRYGVRPDAPFSYYINARGEVCQSVPGVEVRSRLS